MKAAPEAGQSRTVPSDYAITIWYGMNVNAWMRLLCRNRFRVKLSRIPVALIITCFSLANSLLGWLERLTYGRRIARTVIKDHPIFIIGHWRSGTTLLHELLSLDTRHTFPTTFECFIPHHFLLTERFIKPVLNRLIPETRPMDNMKLDMDLPQEDEFALCNAGLFSIYSGIAFPNRLPDCVGRVDIDTWSPRAQKKWEDTFVYFLKKLTWKKNRRIILKSPTHTFRIRTLLKLFPEARFVHIVRNPYKIFPSTVKMYGSLVRSFTLQDAHLEGLPAYTYDMFVRMHAKLDETRDCVPPRQFYEVRYEDLVKDPIGTLQALYRHLGLENFETALLPALRDRLADVSDYKPNRYKLDEATEAEITRQWGTIIKTYGY